MKSGANANACWATILSCSVLLAACGGGGGGDAPPPAPAPAPLNVTLLAGSLKQPGAQDGRGEAAGFNAPQNVAADAAGSLYVSDTGNHTIRKIAPDGTVATLAGAAGVEGAADGTGAAARFSFPHGIAADAAGNVYVADTGNHAVRKITPSGVVTTVAGELDVMGSVDGPRGVARFTAPWDIAIAPDGELLVGGYDYAIRKVAADGSVRTFAGRLGDPAYNGPDAIGTVTGLAVDGSGNVFVTIGTTGAATLRKFNAAGQPVPVVPGGATSFMLPLTADIAADPQGNVYIASGGSWAFAPNPSSHGIANSLHRFGVDGVLQRIAGADLRPGSLDGPAPQALVNQPMGVALAPGGRLVFADSGNHAIRELGADGVVRTIAGGAGLGRIDARGGDARFSTPGPVAAFGGNLYVADRRIPSALRRVAPDGTVSTVTLVDDASGAAISLEAAALPQVRIVQDVVASATRLYVALHTYGFTGEFATVWSCGETLRCRSVYQGAVSSIAVDPSGNLYAASAGSIQRVTPEGAQGTFVPGLQAVPQLRADARGVVLVQPQAHVVQRYGFDGRLALEAGRAGERGDADGPAAQARFDSPRAVALDADGNVFVSDASGKVRRIAVDGTVTTVATLPAAGSGLAWLGGVLYATVYNAIMRLAPGS